MKCYHKKYKSATRDVIFRLQFHTGAIQGHGLVFGKEDLDNANKGTCLPWLVGCVYVQVCKHLHVMIFFSICLQRDFFFLIFIFGERETALS